MKEVFMFSHPSHKSSPYLSRPSLLLNLATKISECVISDLFHLSVWLGYMTFLCSLHSLHKCKFDIYPSCFSPNLTTFGEEPNGPRPTILHHQRSDGVLYSYHLFFFLTKSLTPYRLVRDIGRCYDAKKTKQKKGNTEILKLT